ncbi:MAG: ADP-ribosylglycohydrolase family protein [Verrucomicrobia bacterium]|nr:ADP-ribosylglycohydrolase family protein [Verrucomicrobiota bacterium]MCH8511799.1 ADP-ribosylglycohydrolase family protein [Kiritimatiellia bacterium]
MTSSQNPAPEADRLEWLNRAVWLDGCDLKTEWKQADEEGRDLTSVTAEFERLLSVAEPETGWHPKLGGERNLDWLRQAGDLVDRIQTLPIRKDYPYVEPNALADIQAERPSTPPRPDWTGDKAAFLAKLHGGLLGRMCGCTLGKPVETWTRASIQLSAETTGNWPLQNYWRFYTPEEAEKIEAANPKNRFRHAGNRSFLENLDGMDEDDDINYTAMGYFVVRKKGADFTSLDVAESWCGDLPILRTCTAERVAYRNFVCGITPPHSATARNPYREWIGAQIRADYFGYANPGDPERAAEWAWRDACISHVRNGIYGEMWVAAMLAAAYVESDMKNIILAGLAQIPARCRLADDMKKILKAHAAGKSWEEAMELIHAQWDEVAQHDWCHTNSNAQIVAAALLYGQDDFERTLSLAVMAGFDTDCNGATAGSVWGIVHGVTALPEKWTTPLQDTVRTGVADLNQLRISDLATQMVDVALRNQKEKQ